MVMVVASFPFDPSFPLALFPVPLLLLFSAMIHAGWLKPPGRERGML